MEWQSQWQANEVEPPMHKDSHKAYQRAAYYDGILESYGNVYNTGLFVVTRSCFRLCSPGQRPTKTQEQPISSRRLLGVARVAILQNMPLTLDSQYKKSLSFAS